MSISKRRKPPQGELVGTFYDMLDAGCIQAATDNMHMLFLGLMGVTNKNPCNGCPEWDRVGPACPGYKAYHTEARNKQGTEAAEIVAATEPNNVPRDPEADTSAANFMKEIAAIRGISLNQTRKLKREGKL